MESGDLMRSCGQYVPATTSVCIFKEMVPDVMRYDYKCRRREKKMLPRATKSNVMKIMQSNVVFSESNMKLSIRTKAECALAVPHDINITHMHICIYIYIYDVTATHVFFPDVCKGSVIS